VPGFFKKACRRPQERLHRAAIEPAMQRKNRKSGAARKRRHPRAHGKAHATRWSAQVMRTSDALDLEEGVFKKDSARAIAASLKRSALASGRRKAEPFRSAMSMLNFHINRGGSGLSAERRRVLERAKAELRALFGRSAR
jgi:Protein of unknown function (DUF3175)